LGPWLIAKLDDARRCIGEAMTLAEIGKERWYEAEINRVAGEISLTFNACVASTG
jgi:hypothetical protein